GHHRRVHQPDRAGQADLRRHPRRLRHQGARGRRDGDPLGPGGRRAAGRPAARGDAVGPRPEGGLMPPFADFAFSFDTFPQSLPFIGEHGHLIADKIWQHLQLSGVALLVSLLIGLPLGVLLGHLHRGSFVAINISNIGRALPSIAIIGFGISLFGPTFTNVVIALVVLGAPPILANAYVGVDGVDADVVEAGKGMGLSPWMVLWRLELPLALPLIFGGIRTAAVYIIATATLAPVSGT